MHIRLTTPNSTARRECRDMMLDSCTKALFAHSGQQRRRATPHCCGLVATVFDERLGWLS